LAAARAANRILADKVVAAARAGGVEAGDIRIIAPRNRIGFVGNEAYEMTVALGGEARPRVYSSTVEIRLRNPARFAELQRGLEAAGATDVPDPMYSLTDDTSARRAAKAQAIASAREEADAYARTLGMRVSRVVRVSERASSYVYDAETMQEMFRAVTGSASANDSEVETVVRIAVDYALAPL
jgi:uncharacterized protein